MIVDPDSLLRSMSRRQRLEWEAFYMLDPWDGERADLHAGIIASAAAAPYVECKPADFMPDWLGIENQRNSQREHERQVDGVFESLRAIKAINGRNNK